MNVYIGGPKTIIVSDMQGPAPDGFHVPLSTELEGSGGLKEIMSGLGLTTGDSWRINLHLPFAGKRSPSNSSTSGQGSRGYYWSSSPYDGNQYNSRNLLMESSGVYQNSSYERANGFSIRCFKNSFEAPTSTRTVVQGTLGSAGIFRNQTDGLISITSDGITGHTIQDKNLGATTVYNDGDTLSEANCGKYYQWGNNYGFAWTGSVITSSTTVYASNYGPGNYYESSIFIVNSSYEGYWDSSLNTNLRGGVTQGTSTKTEYQEVQNIYIGEYGWKPSSDTIVWYKLETDTKDYSGNNRDATNNGVTFSDGFGTFSTTNNSSSQGPYIQYDNGLTGGFKTISCWFYKTYSVNGMLCVGDVSRNISNGYIQLRTQNPNGFSIRSSSVGNVDVLNGSYTVQFNKWHLFTLTQNVANNVSGGGTLKIYLDGNYYGSTSGHIDYRVYIIGSGKESNNSYYYNFPGKLSNFILESKERTAQEIAEYYNQTKSNYGL